MAIRFKELLVELSDNTTLSLFHTVLSAVNRAAALDATRLGNDPIPELKEARRTLNSLHEVVDLIAEGDAEAASSLWERHAARTRRLFLNAPISHNLLELMEQSEG
jgi:DNA-binding GntR family transcriptional regulator